MKNIKQILLLEAIKVVEKTLNIMKKLKQVVSNSLTGFIQVGKSISRPSDDITWSVMEDLASRAKRGVDKYNTTLAENNHQNMLQHAYEEALDMAQYLKKEITTLNTVQDLVKNHSNDAELGMMIRKTYGQKETKRNRAKN
jgi:hypothetical protein